MTRPAGLTRLLVKTYVLFCLYRTLRWQAPATMSNEAREIVYDHYRDQLELFAALAKHLLKLDGSRSTKLAPIVRSIDTFDAQRRTCAADHLRVLLAAHQTVLAETKALMGANRALETPGTAEMVGRIAQTNELQVGIVAGQLSMLAPASLSGNEADSASGGSRVTASMR